MNAVVAPSDTLGGIVALTDQLDAAVADVWDAWSTLLYGPSPVNEQPVAAQAQDRFVRATDYLNGNIARLRDLASAIRQRA